MECLEVLYFWGLWIFIIGGFMIYNIPHIRKSTVKVLNILLEDLQE